MQLAGEKTSGSGSALAAAGVAACALLVAIAGGKPTVAAPGPGETATAGTAVQQRLSFEPNAGRTDPRARFVARAPGQTVHLTSTGATVALPAPAGGRGGIVRLTFAGAGAGALRGARRLPGEVNSLVGADPSAWRNGIPTFAQVRRDDLYPGIDLVWRGRKGEVAYDLVVAPGADPHRAAVRMGGADSTRIDEAGNLVVGAGDRELVQRAPVSFQMIGGERVEVPSRFRLEGDLVRFEIGSYDRTRPLVIDPSVLVYSTFVGGSNQDTLRNMVVDGAGNAYVVGETSSIDLPTVNAQQPNQPGQDVFVTKLSPSGNAVYSTYLGGNGDDDGFGIDVASNGRVAVVGQTTSTDLPTSADALQPTNDGNVDGFVTVLTASGTGLDYSTYLGGTQGDIAQAVRFDGAGFFVTGLTSSADLEMGSTLVPLDSTYNTGGDGFLIRLVPSQGPFQYQYATFIGGAGNDRPTDVEVDPVSGDPVLLGVATDAAVDYPTTPGSFDTVHGNGDDGFLSRIDITDGAAGLVYSGFVGANGVNEFAADLELDSTGRAHVAGRTDSTNLPITPGAFDGTPDAALFDAFLAVVDAAGSSYDYLSLYGGSGSDLGTGLDITAGGDAYLTGLTSSSDLPVRNSYDTGANPPDDGFIARIRPKGQGNADLIEGGYLGGAADDVGQKIAVGPGGDIWVGGFTRSVGFPVTSGSYDTQHGGGTFDDGFVTRFGSPAAPDATFARGIEARPVSGEVFVKVPGGEYVPLERLRLIPPGSKVDATDGFVRITAEMCDGVEETATFWDGVFRVRQGGKVGCLLEAKLAQKLRCKKGGKKSAIGAGGADAKRALGRLRRKKRRLWGRGRGRFRTRGRRGSATVRGTTWLTKDTCGATRFKVTEGVGITVRDRGEKPSKIQLGPGDKYTAR